MVKPKAKNAKILGSIAAIILLVSCEHFRRSSPGSSPDATVIVPAGQEAPQSSGADVIKVPDFVATKAPRIGLILGPGGAKTLAQVGVLQELERHKMPIAAVVGLEWGAVWGALYALNGQSHEVDWKMSQLPKVDFSSTNLFSKKLQPAKAKDYTAYLQKVFTGERMESTKIPFACPFAKKESASFGMVVKGKLSAVLKTCWMYPPLFDAAESAAAPYSLLESVKFLKKEGAELIVFVNVLEGMQSKEFSGWSEPELSWLSWLPVHSAIKNAKDMGVNEVLSVDASAFSIVDFEQRLRLIQVGKQGTAGQIEQLIKKYDF